MGKCKCKGKSGKGKVETNLEALTKIEPKTKIGEVASKLAQLFFAVDSTSKSKGSCMIVSQTQMLTLMNRTRIKHKHLDALSSGLLFQYTPLMIIPYVDTDPSDENNQAEYFLIFNVEYLKLKATNLPDSYLGSLVEGELPPLPGTVV